MSTKRINYYFDTDISQINASIVHVMRMCQGFRKAGCEVTLYCTGDEARVDTEDLFRRYGVDTPFRIRMAKIPPFIAKHGHRLAHWYGAWQKSRLKAEPGCNYARSMMSLFFLKGKGSFVFESHVEPDFVNRQIERCLLRHKNCVGLVVISRMLKERYLELFPFFPAEKITVLHDAADPEDPNARGKAALRGNTQAVQIGYVGSLFPGKCMETLLPLAKSCPGYQFHVVGGTPYWVDYWKKEGAELGVENVEFYGFVDNSRLGEYYRAFDLCILPFSKNIYINKNKRVDIGKWTSPLKLFETMAFGRPMVVSRLATIEEVMEDGKDCLMASPDDLTDWKEKLDRLAGDPALQAEFAAAGYEKLCREYTWQVRAEKAAALFDN